MTATETYTRLHRAFTMAARQHGLSPFDVRMLVALSERHGEARTDELEETLEVEGSAVRRSSLPLRAAGYITATAGHGTTRPKRGIRAHLALTATGWGVATRVLQMAYADEPEAVAA